MKDYFIDPRDHTIRGTWAIVIVGVVATLCAVTLKVAFG